MNANWRHEMLEAVDRYCAITGRARSGVGTIILNDAKFFDRINEGKDCMVDTYQKVMQWLEVNLPDVQEKDSPHA